MRFAGFTDAWKASRGTTLFEQFSDKGHPQLPVLSATQDQGMVYRDETDRRIIQDTSHFDTYKRVKPGQFVIHLRSFQGGFAYSAVEGITSPAYTVFGLQDEKQKPEFWAIKFATRRFIDYLKKVTIGIRDGRSIDVPAFMTLAETYPSAVEQSRIAELITTVDSTITLCRRKLDLLTQAKKALMQQIFSQKLRFKADDGSDFPEWEEKKLGDIAKKIDRKAPSDSTADVRMISQGEGFILQSRKYSRNNAGKSLSKYLLLKRNEFAYNHGASKAKPFGVSYRLIESKEARVPYVYHAFSMQLGDLDYWCYALNTESIERQLQQIITSGVRMDGLLNISFDAYMSLSVPYPSLPEQQKIASCLSSADALIDQARSELEQWQEVKKSLLQRMFV